jgi:hypothetical protein
VLAARGDLQHVPGRGPQLGRGGVRVIQGHIQQGTLDRQRRAQLVGGVGGEAALALKGGFQPVEHRVEGHRQLPQLITGPPRAIRPCRLASDRLRAVAVMRRSGRSARPATYQPRPTQASAITDKATPD